MFSEVENSHAMQVLWSAYRKKFSYAADLEWNTVMGAVHRLYALTEDGGGRMKKRGHYCKICGEYKSNEKFSDKGHAVHICKACASLPPEKKSEMAAMNRLLNLPSFPRGNAGTVDRKSQRRSADGIRGGTPK